MHTPRIFVMVLVLLGCGFVDEGKIPITTSSEEARQLYLQGRDLSERIRAKESLVYYAKAVEKDPNFALAYLAMANNAQTTKDFFDNLEKASALASKSSEGEQMLIAAAQAGASGEFGKQTALYEKLVVMFPRDERAHNLLGANYQFVQQKFQQAIEQYQKAIVLNSKFSPVYNSMGYAFRSLEKYEEAADVFRKYTEMIPDDPNPYDSYAELLMKMGRYDESITNYRKALSLRPDFTNSHMGIATNYIFKRQYDSALATLDAFYPLAKNDGERRTVLFVKALAAADQGNFDEALKQLQNQFVIAEKMGDAGARAGDLFAMGVMLLEAGNPDLAQSKFDAALAMSESSGLADGVKQNVRRNYQLNTALVAIAKNNMPGAKTEAAACAKAALAANNTFQIMGSHQLNGLIALAEKDGDKAVNEFLQANLQDPYTIYRLGLAYEVKGDKAKAEELFNKAKNFNAFFSINQCFVRHRALVRVF